MQLQIYIKPQDEAFIKNLQERCKALEFKGVKSLSELILKALKSYEGKEAAIDISSSENIEDLIDRKIQERLNPFKEELLKRLSSMNKQIEEPKINEENLEALSAKNLAAIIEDYLSKNPNINLNELFQNAKANFKGSNLNRQIKEDLIKVVQFIHNPK